MQVAKTAAINSKLNVYKMILFGKSKGGERCKWDERFELIPSPPLKKNFNMNPQSAKRFR